MIRLILLCITASSLFYGQETMTFSGIAYDEKGEEIFKEEYTIEKEGEEILSVSTTFFSPVGEKMATMGSCFSPNSYLPKVTFDSLGNDFHYGTKCMKDSIEIFKQSARQTLRTKRLEKKDNMVVGHGFYFYILSRLNDLLRGQKESLIFLQPSRLGVYSFSMTAFHDSSMPGHIKVELLPESKLLKHWIPKIELVIEEKTRSLVSYKGISGFFSDDRSLKTIHVKYSPLSPAQKS